jgi:hypothetical protein
LELSKNNVKGLFRRGQARVALGKLSDARKGNDFPIARIGMTFFLSLDFSDVLLVEPSNTAAQEEMRKLTMLVQQEKAKV